MKKLISEDQKIYDVQRQMMGMKNQSDPQANTVGKLVSTGSQHPNEVKVPNQKPYPLEYSDQILSNMYLDMLNFKKMLDTALGTPSLKPEHKVLLNNINNKVQAVNKLVVEISQDIDKIV